MAMPKDMCGIEIILEIEEKKRDDFSNICVKLLKIKSKKGKKRHKKLSGNKIKETKGIKIRFQRGVKNEISWDIDIIIGRLAKKERQDVKNVFLI